MLDKSTPNLTEYSPLNVPFHRTFLRDYAKKIDWSIGTHEFLLSGSVGSGKSLLCAHVICKHALKYPKARILIGRRSLPDLKKTLFTKIVEHLIGVDGLNIDEDFEITESTGRIRFINGSEIISGSWADKRYLKFRSLELSMAVIEEAIENTGDDYNAIKEIRQRVGRLPHIRENAILYATNPGSPSSELYKYFFEETQPTRHVYYSLTDQNPYLPKTYVEQLRRDLSEKEVLRMLEGKWIELQSERIYYSYEKARNFINADYRINLNLPITLSFDFNIGVGKPMSAVLAQYDPAKDTFHFFDEVILHGSRTDDVLEEVAARGYLDLPCVWHIYGDATGGARTTNSKLTNYEIITSFFNQYRSKTGSRLSFELCVPKSNPPIRERHNIVNAYCHNRAGEVRLFVYQKCKTLNEGFMLTALKSGSVYLEDDSKPYQHSTTSAGYFVSLKSKTKTIHKGGNL